ncbi:MAG TPA: alpha/beta hydrolase [Kosmotogaceae bacterium]|nr:MAG: Alpha/beta hydrolase fold protein [Thermotogales bacterium 46_20]HAA85098.1 alpha/beta hydrolase [Kosmotogaceae bacterium]
MYAEMSDGARLYYELYGDHDDPLLVFLNGIMMSTASWQSFVEPLSRHFSLLLVDQRDQGRSDHMDRQYDIELHARDLEELFTRIDAREVNLMGVSYGGQIAELYALQYGERLNSLILSNTVGRITPYLAELGEAWKEAARLNDGEKFFTLAIPFIYSDSFYNSNLAWLKNRQKAFKELLTEEWFEGFYRLASSNIDFNVVERLNEIKVPTLLLAADRDIVTPVEEMELLHEEIPNSEFLIIHDAGHAAFLEKQEEFLTAVTGFVIKKTSKTRA